MPSSGRQAIKGAPHPALLRRGQALPQPRRRERSRPTDLLAAVVRHKTLFFRSGWANYDSARPGIFRLVPSTASLPRLRSDYAEMQEVMIFGDAPSFDELLATLTELESHINKLA